MILIPRRSKITKLEWKKETTIKFAVYSVFLVEYVNRLNSKLRQCVHCKVVIKATDGKITSLENDFKSGKSAPVGSMQPSITTAFVSEIRTGKEGKGIRHAAQLLYVSNLTI